MLSYIFIFFTSLLFLECLSRLVVKKIHKVSRLKLGIEMSEFIASKSIYYKKKNTFINVNKLFEPRPYGLYWNSGNFHENGQKQTDSNGFRYKGYNISKEKRLFRVLVYGGSTTFSTPCFFNICFKVKYLSLIFKESNFALSFGFNFS